MPLDLSRRRLLAASLGLLVAPSIVRAASIMPVKVVEPPLRYMGLDSAFDPPGMAQYLVVFQRRLESGHIVWASSLVTNLMTQDLGEPIQCA